MASLGDICKFQSGGTPAKGEPSYFGGSIPWITTVVLNGSIIDEQDAVDWITEKAIEKSAAKVVPANSVMVGTRVGVGKVAINKVPMSTSQDIISLLDIDESKWSKEFICKFILGKGSYLSSQARGATIKGIKIETLAGLELPDVTLEQQNKIANVIDSIDKLISLRKEQFAKLDQLVKSRFIELFGSVKNNHQGYPIVKIGSCAKLQGGFAFKSSDYLDDGIRLVQISNVNKDTLDWDSTNCVPQAYLQKYKDFELHVGDLVLAMTRPVIKSLDAVKIATVSENDIPSLLNQRVGRFVIDKAKLNSIYLMLSCQMPEFREYVEAMSGNSLQPNISSKQVEDYSIVLPPLPLQEQFAVLVEQTDKSKFDLKQSLEKLEMLKKSLMQQYFG